MSSSKHPRALSIQRRVGDPARLLATVMLLPLIDGIFPALVLAGALDSVAGILEVGILIFGGSATLAIILAEMDGDRREQLKVIGIVGVPLLTLAVVEAALAPTIDTAIDLLVFERFAGLVILAVAASTVSATVAEYMPRPAVIVALGFVASVDPSGAQLALSVDSFDFDLMLRAAAAALVGIGFATSIALAGPYLRNAVDIDRFRFGSAVALGVLSLSVFGVIPGEAPIALAVLAVTALLAFDPGRAQTPEWEYHPDDIDITAALADGGRGDVARVASGSGGDAPGSGSAPTDSPASAADAPAAAGVTADTGPDGGTDTDPDGDDDPGLMERAPWL
jgi:hypothetical protein